MEVEPPNLGDWVQAQDPHSIGAWGCLWFQSSALHRDAAAASVNLLLWAESGVWEIGCSEAS